MIAVLAAGEVWFRKSSDGTWEIRAINNRSYGYMPGAESWAAVDRALSGTGVPYPEAFTEVYPLEGSWADVLEVLRR